MEEFITRVRSRLASGAYVNEAAISVGILMTILQQLGWDTADPDQVIPEYTTGRGRVDFALCGTPSRPAVFVEVKAVGRSLEGDRQLFEYAFHEGAPLCVLTDGREWSFYLPSGQGSYDDRRVYRLQLDERAPVEAVRIFNRYLARVAVKSGRALEDAAADYRDAASRREAARSLPIAWTEIIEQKEELLLELICDKTEALCGFRPPEDSVWSFLAGRTIKTSQNPSPSSVDSKREAPRAAVEPAPYMSGNHSTRTSRAVHYQVFGQDREATSAAAAFVDILRSIVARDPSKLPALAREAKGRSRNHIGRTPEEIYPRRPELARAEVISGEWMVGLNISNRDKSSILRAALSVYGLLPGKDIKVTFPNE